MNTTALAVELLVIGYQVLFWIALLVGFFLKFTQEEILQLREW